MCSEFRSVYYHLIIVNYYHFFFSLNGYSNPLSFKNISNDTFEELEMLVRLQFVNLLSSCDDRNENIEKLIVGSNASVDTFSFTEQEKNLVSRGTEHIKQIFASNSNNAVIAYFDNENYVKSDKIPDLCFHKLNQSMDDADKKRNRYISDNSNAHSQNIE